MSDTNNHQLNLPQEEHPTPPPLPPSEQAHPNPDGVAGWIKRSSANVRGSTAPPVGQGVPRRHSQHVSPEDPDAKKKEETPPDHTLDDDWTDRPQLKDQIQREEGSYWKFDRTEAKIYDLSNPEQLAAYTAMLTESTRPDANLVILAKESKWSDKTDNWKILVEIQYIRFRKILLTKNES
jgi:hypothetical protein